jgi:hypothetical protein
MFRRYTMHLTYSLPKRMQRRWWLRKKLSYETAYDGAYGENPSNSEPCIFSSNGLTDGAVLRGESAFTDIPSGQWMSQSFADQTAS